MSYLIDRTIGPNASICTCLPNVNRVLRLCPVPEAAQQQHGGLRELEAAAAEAQVRYKYPTVESVHRAHDRSNFRCT